MLEPRLLYFKALFAQIGYISFFFVIIVGFQEKNGEFFTFSLKKIISKAFETRTSENYYQKKLVKQPFLLNHMIPHIVRTASINVPNTHISQLLIKRTIVNVYRNKQKKELSKLLEENKVEELFEKLKKENEMLDEKYRYASQSNGLEYTPTEKKTVATNEGHYDITNNGFVDEATKQKIYANENIPRDKHGVPLPYTSDPKTIYDACYNLSWRNYTPVDSKKYTHSHIQGQDVIFEDGVQIKMNVEEFVTQKLVNFLDPKRLDIVLDRKITAFKNGGRGATVKKGNERYGDKKLTLLEIQDIQNLQANFRVEFKDEIDYYNNNYMKDSTLKKPQLDIEAISHKYEIPPKAVQKILKATTIDKYKPEHLAMRLKRDHKKLQRRNQNDNKIQ